MGCENRFTVFLFYLCVILCDLFFSLSTPKLFCVSYMKNIFTVLETIPAAPIKRTRSNFVQISDQQADWLSKIQPDEHMTISEKLLIESATEKGRVSTVKEEAEVKHHAPETHILHDEGHQHQCLHCTKSFKKPSDLVRHIRIHTGEKPYGCEICTRTFTVKSTLESHMKTHTPGEFFVNFNRS